MRYSFWMLKLSKMIVGLTVVSFATSAPELIVSIQGALNGLSGLAIGNVVGSNIANIGMVLGVTAIITPLAINLDFFKFNWPWMMGLSLLCYVLLWTGYRLERWEGALLILLLVLFLITLIRRARRQSHSKNVLDIEDIPDSQTLWWKLLAYLSLGGLLLWIGSDLLVEGAVGIANALKIPDGVIAVSMIAIGTSIPELAASIIAAMKKERALSLGNLVGSNIFNIGSVLGLTSIIQPVYLSNANLSIIENDIFWMIGFAFALLPLAVLHLRLACDRLTR